MKNWLKFLTLSFICVLTTLIFVACEKSVSAASFQDDNQKVIDANQPQIGNEIEELAETPAPCQHEQEDSTVTTAPTCCTDGIRTYRCIVCGHERDEIIPANPEKHDTVEETVASTCTQKGYHAYRCLHCHELIGEIEYFELADHDYDPNNHRCKNCDQYQPPIQNLAGSIWYLKTGDSYEYNASAWLINFETFNGQTSTGECYTFKSNGDLTEYKKVSLYPDDADIGEYKLIAQNNNYYINFTKDKSHADNASYIGLIYSETTIDDRVYYTLKDTGCLFSETYQDCVLIFMKYGV